jgi:hypothetical protein
VGFSIAWIAIKGRSRAEVLAAAQLRDTGEADRANDTPVSGASFPDGWYVLFFNDLLHPSVSAEALTALSMGCTVVGCQVEEHVMLSAGFLYRDGAQIWRVSHDADLGTYHLELEGTPPEGFSTDKYRQDQDAEGGKDADVDVFFDAPLDAAQGICGYRHDCAQFDWGDPAFTRLVPLKEGMTAQT